MQSSTARLKQTPSQPTSRSWPSHTPHESATAAPPQSPLQSATRPLKHVPSQPRSRLRPPQTPHASRSGRGTARSGSARRVENDGAPGARQRARTKLAAADARAVHHLARKALAVAALVRVAAVAHTAVVQRRAPAADPSAVLHQAAVADACVRAPRPAGRVGRMSSGRRAAHAMRRHKAAASQRGVAQMQREHFCKSARAARAAHRRSRGPRCCRRTRRSHPP